MNINLSHIFPQVNFTCTALVLWFCGYVATQHKIRIVFVFVMFLTSICESIEKKKLKLLMGKETLFLGKILYLEYSLKIEIHQNGWNMQNFHLKKSLIEIPI